MWHLKLSSPPEEAWEWISLDKGLVLEVSHENLYLTSLHTGRRSLVAVMPDYAKALTQAYSFMTGRIEVEVQG